jgi:hypothetical protein
MNQVTAMRTGAPLTSSGLPDPSAWETALPISFQHDWRGEHSDPQRETRAQFLWSDEYLFVQFICRYRRIHVFDGGKGRRDQLWLRDVAELFIRPGRDDPMHYKEFEISPNGSWLDLDIDHGQRSILYCDLKSRVRIDDEAFTWSAELAIPLHCLSSEFNPDEVWRLNLFRIEGPEPGRFYSAWRPTFTPIPNFHVPEYFGELHFTSR